MEPLVALALDPGPWTDEGCPDQLPMKKLIPILLAALLSVSAYAADQAPLFNATLTMGKEHRFMLVSAAGKSSSWLKLGESFEDYTIKAYDAPSSTLDLEREGKILHVKLVGDAAVTNAPMPVKATLADAEEVFRVMRFDEMMAKMLESQKKAIGPMLEQSMSQAATRMKLSDEDKAAFLAFQKKAFDEVMSSVMGPEMRADMAKIYSEVFTKEELGGLSAFYGTPAGQALVDKTPEVTAKTQAVMMPRMMQSMQKMQQASKDFAAELAAKHAAGAGDASLPQLPQMPAKP